MRVELYERVLGVSCSSSDERTMTEFRFGILWNRFYNKSKVKLRAKFEMVFRIR